MSETIQARFLVRRGTASDLAAVNEVPLLGELVFETDQNLATGLLKLKMGDGSTHYNALPYMTLVPEFTAKGDILVMTAAGPVRLPVGPNSYQLTADSTQTAGMLWQAPAANTLPLTTKGDMLGHDGSNPVRVPIGATTGFVPKVDPLSSVGWSWQAEGTGAADYSAEVLADSPVGFWKFDDASGTTAHDYSTNANNGTYAGGFRLLGSVGPANLPGGVLLDGASGIITVPAISAYNVTTAWSLEAWSMPQVDPGSSAPNFITEKFTGGSNPVSFGLGINVSGSFGGQFGAAYYTGGGWQSCDGPVVSKGELAHSLVTYDGTNLLYYHNGVLVRATTPASHVASNDGLIMGAGNTGTNNWFRGILSCCAIYNTVLTPARIKAHYLAGR